MISKNDLALEGKVIYLLALIALVQFTYPITAYGTAALIVYEILYASMIVVGVVVGRDSQRHTLFLGVTGFIYRTYAEFFFSSANLHEFSLIF